MLRCAPSQFEQNCLAVFCFLSRVQAKERDQEGRRGSEEVVPENFSVPLEGDRDVGALCGSHQG